MLISGKDFWGLKTSVQPIKINYFCKGTDYIKEIIFYTLYKKCKGNYHNKLTNTQKPDQQLQAMQADRTSWTPEGLIPVSQLKHLHRREETWKGDSSL